MRVKRLFVYPVKSCAGIEVDHLDLLPHGPRYDREFMIVGEEGNFLTQRSHPKICLIQTRLWRDRFRSMHLILDVHGQERSFLLDDFEGKVRNVVVWGDWCSAIDQGNDIAEILSAFLEVSCRLVRHDPARYPRLRTSSTTGLTIPVSFADAYPLLIIGEESLYDLNLRLPSAIGMDRFRPNIVVEGAAPYAEDEWVTASIAGVTLQGATACVRCVTTTTEQTTGHRSSLQEPLRTLAQYRKTEKGVVFGRNFIHVNMGVIPKGATVSVA